MKTLAQIVIFVLCFCSINYKAQVYFNNRYDTYSSCDGTNSIDTMFNGYVSAGITCSTVSFYTFLLNSYNYNGTIKNSKAFLIPNNNFLSNYGKYIRLNNTQFLVSGSRAYKPDTTLAFLWRFNASLDSISYKEYGFPNQTNVISAHIQSGSYIYMVGYNDVLATNSDILLIKTDTAGNEIWKKKIGIPGWDESAFSIQITADSKLAICGHKGVHNTSNDGMYLMKVDTSGLMIWDKYYPSIFGAFLSVKTLSDSSCIVAGGDGLSWVSSNVYSKNVVARIDVDGNEIWKKYYGPLSNNTGFVSIIENNKGNFTIAGQRTYTNNTVSGTVYEINQNGDSIFSKEYRLLPNSQNYFRDVMQVYDKGYCFAGFLSPMNGDGGSQDIWLLKVDSNFCESNVSCGYPTGIRNISFALGVMTLYPNPAQNELIFKFENGVSEDATIAFMDILGKLVVEYPLQIKVNNEAKLNVSELPNGLYYYRINQHNAPSISGKVTIFK